jgi:RNA polymerase sigma-70 factor (ECF subfamily)
MAGRKMLDARRIEPTDEELLGRIGDRDMEALGELYDQYSRAAFTLAYRMLTSAETAEEIVQDAFLSVWKNAGTYDGRVGLVRPWLLSIVHHRAIDRLRRASSRHRTAQLDDAWMLAADVDVFADVYRGLRRDEIRRALADLPADQGVAIDLAYFKGMTFNEIAEAVGAPVGTVKSRVRLGLARLRQTLDREIAS